MSDDFGNLSGGDINTAIGVGMAAKRAAPFVKGAIESAQGAQVGKMVGSAIAKKVVAQTAVKTGVSMAAGAAAGAEAGSIVPGVGTAIGLVVGAIAPHIIKDDTTVGKALGKIPLFGSALVGKTAKKADTRDPGRVASSPFTAVGALPTGGLTQPGAASTMSGAAYSASSRGYRPGRGFR